MVKTIARALFIALIALSCTYLGDLGVLQFRHDPTGTVSVRKYYAVPRNDKREELMFDDPQDETCINALFPHREMSPCWYLRRHPEKRISL